MTKRHTCFAKLLLGSTALLFSQASMAQTASSSGGGIDGKPGAGNQSSPDTSATASTSSGAAGGSPDIVVTALRRETSIQKTPLAITAVSGQQLATMGISSTADLQRVAPGLQFRQTSNGGSRVIIRNIQAAGEPVVGLYYDEVPVISSTGLNNDAGETTPSIRLFDVDRVEVLRGPQGTLYGSSSMAGTIRLLFNNAKVDRYEGAVASQGYSVAHGDLGSETQGMVNLPLVDGLLGARLVGFYRQGGGWIDDPTLGKKNINATEARGGRAMVRLQASPAFTLDGMAVIQDATGNNGNFLYNAYYAGTGKPYLGNYAALQPQKDFIRIYSGTARWDVGPVAVTGVASWSRRFRYYAYDASVLLDRIGQGPGVNSTGQRTTQETQELRVSNARGGDLSYTAGLFHSVRHENDYSELNLVDRPTGRIITPSTPGYRRRIETDLEQTAAFANVSYRLFDKLTIEAGGRYYRYHNVVGGDVTIPNLTLGLRTAPFQQAKAGSSGWLYKANVAYEFTPEILGYLTTSTGFRPGGANQGIGLPAQFVSYKADKLTNYEAGLKTSWFDRKLTLNVDLFQIDWNDLQTTADTPDGLFSFVTNAGKVRVRGIEGDAALRPAPGVLLQASGSYIIAKLREDQVAGGAAVESAGFKGDYIPYTPKVTMQASAEYGWDLDKSLRMTVHGDVAYIGTMWSRFQHILPVQSRLPGYATVAARVTLAKERAGWGVDLFVTNLLDKVGLTYLAQSSLYGGAAFVRADAIAPRTIGIAVRKKF